MRNFETFEYVIPAWAMSALINGDHSGISEEDSYFITALEEHVIHAHGIGHWSYDTEQEPSFRRDNDLHSLADDCLDVQWVVFQEDLI